MLKFPITKHNGPFNVVGSRIQEIDNVLAWVNGEPVNLDVPATLLKSRTMVPLRFIAESLGAEVEWDETTRTVSVNSYVKPIEIEYPSTEKVVKLKAPTGLSAKALSSSEIQISWNYVSGADYFKLYASDSYSGPYYELYEDNSGKNIFTWHVDGVIVHGLHSGTTKYFKIKAVRNGEESNYSSIASATTFTVKPNAPTGVWAKALSSSEIQIGWNNVSGADYYHVYYAYSYNGPYYAFSDNVGSKAKQYNNSLTAYGIPSGTTCYYKVTTVKDGLESNYSNVVSATTLSPIPAPRPTPTYPTLPAYGLHLIADDGTYLGKLTTNEFDSAGIFNEFGTYGSKFSSKSIWNEFGTYGSKFSSQSPFNDFTSTPPYIVTSDGKIVGRLTTNKFVSGAISPYVIYSVLIDLGL